MTLPRPSLLALFLFLIALALLLPGITEITGITGKDEYLLSLRTPLHMIEGGHGWLPWLDGEPRLKKPPLLYWLARISYETFGVSLFSGRLIGVLFAALLTMVTGLLAWKLYRDKNVMLFAGIIILSTLGVMIDGRRLMLDIPVAALSGLAVLFLVYWRSHGRMRDILFSSLALGLSFLMKGPVGFFFYFSAVVALMVATPGSALFLRRQWLGVVLAVVTFSLITVPWFVYLASLYPQLLSDTFASEVTDRNLFSLSISPLFSLLAMSLPWSPVLVAILLSMFWNRKNVETRKDVPDVTSREDGLNTAKFLVVWLLLSLLPFFFFKSFSRYLYGCMIPLTLLVSTIYLDRKNSLEKYRRWLLTGAALSILIGTSLMFFLFWFRGFQPIMIVPILFLLAFATCWWQAKNLIPMALLASLYWVGLFSIVYPAFGINKLPAGILEQVKDKYVVLYAGPQPAMLPIVAKQGMRDGSRLNLLPVEKRDSCDGIILISPVKHFITARMQLDKLNHQWTEVARYRVLSSRGSWLRIAHEDATAEDWKQAFKNKDLDSLATELILVKSKARDCL